MTRRAIVIFPAFKHAGQAAEIERLRQAYDPLAAAIPAHITEMGPESPWLEPGDAWPVS